MGVTRREPAVVDHILSDGLKTVEAAAASRLVVDVAESLLQPGCNRAE